MLRAAPPARPDVAALSRLVLGLARRWGRDVAELRDAVRYLALDLPPADVAEDRLGGSPAEILARYYQRRLAGPVRRRLGAFYTPPAIARQVAQLTLAPLAAPTRILDPAMGSGIFLLEAIRALPGDPAHLAETCLWGLDLDPLAVDLAIVSLWLETGAQPERLARRLRQADTLAEPLEPRSFDAVLGNPPWGSLYPAAERAALVTRFPAAAGTFDAAKLFLDLGTQLTRGTLGMIVPTALLEQAGHAALRDRLLERLDPYAVLSLPLRAFPAAAPSCALIFGSRPGPAQISIHSAEECRTIPAVSWHQRRSFSLAPPGELGLLSRLAGRHPSLGELSVYRVRDCGLNYNRAAFAARSIYRGARQHPDDLPLCRGGDFQRYTPVQPSAWLRHDYRDCLAEGEQISLGLATYRLPEKLLIRQTADRLVATLDRSRVLFGRSVLALTAEGNVSLPALLAWLNSRLLTTLYRILAGEEGRILPQVKVGRLRALPVPAVAAQPIDPRQEVTGALPLDPTLLWAELHFLGLRQLAAGGRDEAVQARIEVVAERLAQLDQPMIFSRFSSS